VKATHEVVRATTTSVPAPAQPATLGPASPPTLARRVAVRLGDQWLPRAAWTVSRTGRAGLVGIALLLAAALFLLSTHRQVTADVAGLRADLATAQSTAHTAVTEPVADPSPVQALPARDEVPEVLRQLFAQAKRAGLAVDTAKYEIVATKGSVVRYQIAFPVTGPYPQVRAFIDSTLETMPAVGLRELALERKSIADTDVEAQLRFTIYTRSAP
jgi:hypothetical protein